MSRPKAFRPAKPFACALLPILAATPAAAQFRGDEFGMDFVAEELEVRNDAVDLAWDVAGTAGTARNRAWLRTEGEVRYEGISDYRAELLWGRPIPGFAELVTGVRHDWGTLPSRTYAALGLQSTQGTALQWEATGYLGDGSQRADVHAGLRLQARYGWRLAERWNLRARVQFEYWNEDHERFAEGTGSGPCELRAGLRLGYAPGERVTWYVGAEWLHQLQDSAELTAKAGGDPRNLGLVAGLRVGI
jgi:copper resistance protein B